MMIAPMEGATAGIRMKIIITKDMIRAIVRPFVEVATSAMDTIRGPAAPRPCTSRARSSISIEVAIAAPMAPRM